MPTKMYEPRYEEISLFAGLDRNEINEILQLFRGSIKYYPKNDYIYLAGDCVENLCVVLEGSVQMLKEDAWGEKSIIANLEEGAVFAENFLGKLGDRSSVSYFAASNTRILMLPIGRDYYDSLGNCYAVQKLLCNIVGALADNNTRLLEKNEILCQKTLRSKIMAYLEQEARYSGSNHFTIPFNRTDLANYLDADRSALTRELGRMRDEGIIAFEKNTFTIAHAS
ncbi:Crp/Fnr family transcriptional regulator [Phascolarctobacterium sp.]|uniref:Crp/Fnr family transcriptional regulator n=1 Tax=Phascolarctobacterium sp. TaxID=2049039 RepID=UPI00386CB9BB